MEKMKKTAKGIEIFLKILFWVTVVCTVITVVFSLVMGFAGENAFLQQNGQFGVSLAGVNVYLGSGAPAEASTRAYWFIAAGMAIVSGIGCACVLRVLKNVVGPMKEGRPFAESVSRDLRRLGWISIVCGVAVNIFDGIGKDLVAKALTEFDALGQGAAVSVSHGLNVTFFVAAAFCFLFSFVFRYGNELQELSDETL